MNPFQDSQLDPFNPEVWQGRVDREDPELSLRLHQTMASGQGLEHFNQASVILGFACDEGVRRNQGRVGAAAGPDAIRAALAPLALPKGKQCYDLGTVSLSNQNLEAAQALLAEAVQSVIARDGFPLVLGGGHEVAWGSYCGLRQALGDASVGILNFDAHFDLRNPVPTTSSGTPFRQIAALCQAQGQAFRYWVIGINRSSNSQALLRTATNLGVIWTEDLDCHLGNWPALTQALSDYIDSVDALYITVCMDVFNGSEAPGVSAPAALGIHGAFAVKLLRYVFQTAGHKVRLMDVAETNPRFDREQITAKLAARLLWEAIDAHSPGCP